MPQVTVYTRNTCAPCAAVKMYLSRKGINYTELNVDNDPRLMDEVVTRSGFLQVPMIDVGGAVISGANFGAIARALDI